MINKKTGREKKETRNCRGIVRFYDIQAVKLRAEAEVDWVELHRDRFPSKAGAR